MTTSIKKEIFQYLNLSKRAQIIYLEILEKGMVTATYLSQKLSLPRSTAYLELGSLQGLGLISMIGSHKKRKFVIESPKRILEIINNKEEEAQRISGLAQVFIEDITEKMRQSSWIVPTINFFQGKKGVQRAIRLTTQAMSREVLGIIPSSDLYEILGENFLKKYTEDRIRKKIKIKNIWPKNQVPEILKKHKEQLRNLRFSKSLLTMSSAIITFDNKVIIITSKKELLSVVITSRDLAQAIKILFNVMWDNSV